MTSEQQQLFDNANDSLKAAHLLKDHGLFDISVSRAYYAMFYLAQAFLLAEKISYARHAAVIAAFGKMFVKPGRVPEQFHRYLIEALDLRNVGDYASDLRLSKENAQDQISRAEALLQFATSYLQ